MLLLGICLVQAGQHQQNGSRWLGATKRSQVRHHIFLRVIERFDRYHKNVRPIV